MLPLVGETQFPRVAKYMSPRLVIEGTRAGPPDMSVLATDNAISLIAIDGKYWQMTTINILLKVDSSSERAQARFCQQTYSEDVRSL